jgi:hypothetical protein
MMGCTFDTSGFSSSGVKWRFQSASSLLQNLWVAQEGRTRTGECRLGQEGLDWEVRGVEEGVVCSTAWGH